MPRPKGSLKAVPAYRCHKPSGRAVVTLNGKDHYLGVHGSAASRDAYNRVPRISRLMALAIRFDGMLRRGEVKDLAEIARLGHVTRARATQIMNLLMLAPDLQEALLFLPEVEEGRDPVREWQVRPIAAEALWTKQRRMWSRSNVSVLGR